MDFLGYLTHKKLEFIYENSLDAMGCTGILQSKLGIIIYEW